MMRKAIDDTNITLGSFPNKGVFTSLVVFIEKWNRIVDIMNGRDEYYSEVNGRSIQEELLTTLSWLTVWKQDHDQRVEDGINTIYNFFAPETWNCMQMLILSHVVVIEYWCIGKGMKVNPRVLNTDPVEHHFGNCRQMVGGSHAGLNVMGFDQGDTKSGLVKAANYNNVGNNKNANKVPTKKKQEPKKYKNRHACEGPRKKPKKF